MPNGSGVIVLCVLLPIFACIAMGCISIGLLELCVWRFSDTAYIQNIQRRHLHILDRRIRATAMAQRPDFEYRLAFSGVGLEIYVRNSMRRVVPYTVRGYALLWWMGVFSEFKPGAAAPMTAHAHVQLLRTQKARRLSAHQSRLCPRWMRIRLRRGVRRLIKFFSNR